MIDELIPDSAKQQFLRSLTRGDVDHHSKWDKRKRDEFLADCGTKPPSFIMSKYNLPSRRRIYTVREFFALRGYCPKHYETYWRFRP